MFNCTPAFARCTPIAATTTGKSRYPHFICKRMNYFFVITLSHLVVCYLGRRATTLPCHPEFCLTYRRAINRPSLQVSKNQLVNFACAAEMLQKGSPPDFKRYQQLTSPYGYVFVEYWILNDCSQRAKEVLTVNRHLTEMPGNRLFYKLKYLVSNPHLL